MIKMNTNNKIFVAGASGMVGSAITRALIRNDHTNIIGSYNSHKPDQKNVFSESSGALSIKEHDLRLIKVDLTNQQQVNALFESIRPDYIFLAAARVGGIYANSTYPADFIRVNLQIQTNVIHAAFEHGVKKLLFLGSSCIYPRNSSQPLKEEYLLTGPLEKTNESYAVAKIAGIKMCQAYRKQFGFDAISLMPTNLFGPGDNYDLENSHVIPALLRKMHLARCLETGDWEAVRKDLNIRPVNGIDGRSSIENISDCLSKHGIESTKNTSLITVKVWGTGTPRREFLHVDDLAVASLFLMQHYDTEEIINVGTGQDMTISHIAGLIAQVTGFDGRIVFDSAMPDGTPCKLLDVGRINALGWKAGISLRDGITDTYQWYRKNQEKFRV
jgi:GDP-L-fucose synthase